MGTAQQPIVDRAGQNDQLRNDGTGQERRRKAVRRSVAGHRSHDRYQDRRLEWAEFSSVLTNCSLFSNWFRPGKTGSAGHVHEPAVMALEGDGHGPGRAVAVFDDEQVRFAGAG